MATIHIFDHVTTIFEGYLGGGNINENLFSNCSYIIYLNVFSKKAQQFLNYFIECYAFHKKLKPINHVIINPLNEVGLFYSFNIHDLNVYGIKKTLAGYIKKFYDNYYEGKNVEDAGARDGDGVSHGDCGAGGGGLGPGLLLGGGLARLG